MMRLSARWSAAWPGAVCIALVLALLEVASARRWVDPALLPPPTRVFAVLLELVRKRETAGPLLTTLGHLGAGFVLGAVPAIAIGLAMGYWRIVYRLFEPIVELLRPLPKPALVPALILFLGVGAAMKNASVALAVFFPVLLNTINGVRSVDPTLLATARTLRLGHVATVWKIILPAAMPSILAGLRISLALALVLAVLSEMLAGNDGLGFLIVDMQRRFRLRYMYAWLVVLAVVGVVINAAFGALERRSLRWQPTAERGLWSA
jgi:ABC-type nitrate/sulfonate/bicarbonate transport system permease component